MTRRASRCANRLPTLRARNQAVAADGLRKRRRRWPTALGLLFAATIARAEAGPSEPTIGSAEPLRSVVAADAEPSRPAGPRPRIALVLSGGGARGGAHIGVLEVLEELRVPVDVVVGTSMGSIVGGLYAAGLSPDELREEVESIDWVDVFDDEPDRRALSFRRREDDRNFLTNMRLAFKDRTFYVPPGVVEGQKLEFLLRTLTMGERGVARIEDLQLPFRAVATDIRTGEAIVLGHGTLATAQRASMSIPAVFSPVEVDGHLLVDGYLANNLPIDVAEALGAEVVIAVDVSTPLAEVDAETSALGINAQASVFATQANQQIQKQRLDDEDVLLTPELGEVGSASFSRMPEAVEAGRRAAQAASESLARHALSEEAYSEWRAHHRRPTPTLPVIDEIRIENESSLADRLVRTRVRSRVGEPLDLEMLRSDLERLFGLDAFQRVTFDLRLEGGRTTLVYQLVPRLRGRNYFRVGLALETDLGNDAGYNVGLNHVLLPMNRWGGELRNYVQLGDDYVASSEIYQPLDARDWVFLLPQFRFRRSDLDVYREGDRVARYAIETIGASIDIGVSLGRFARVRGGIGYRNGEADRQSGDPASFRNRHFESGYFQATFEYDSLDDTRFPNDGSIVVARGQFLRESLGNDESVEVVSVRAATFRTFWRNTIGLAINYDTTFGASREVEFLNAVGGFGRLSGFERDSIVGPHTGVARLIGYRRIASPAIFAWEFPVYLGAQYETGNAWRKRSDIDDLRHSVGPFFGLDTPLGPFYVAYAYGEGGEHQGYLFLGQSF